MRLIPWSALTCTALALTVLPGRADPPTPPEAKQTEKPNQPGKRVDLVGDPLPDGAVMRLGTRRHRADLAHSALPFHWQSRPDGKSYVTVQRNGEALKIRRVDSKTGAVVESWPIVKHDDRVVGISPGGRYVLLTRDYLPHGLVEEAQDWHLTLSDLTERERDVVRARFGFDGAPERLLDIAERLGISPERVRQIEEHALAKLRHAA